MFGQLPSSQSSTQGSLFGKPQTTSAVSSNNPLSLFSGPTTTAATSGSLFGTGNLFGSAAQVRTTAPTATESAKPVLTNQYFTPTPVASNANEAQRPATGPNLFGISESSSPAVIPFGTKLTTASSLFGGQTTLTTAKPSSASSGEKYGAILSALNSSPVTANIQNRPIIVRTAKPEPKPSIKQPTPVTANAPVPSNPAPNADKAEADSLISTLIKRECAALESELKALLQHGKGIEVNIGTENEKTYITDAITELQEFIKEIDDVNADQQDEVSFETAWI